MTEHIPDAETTAAAEEFERRYAARSAVPVAVLRQYKTVRRCRCGDESCEGFASVSVSGVADWDAEAPRFGQVAGSVIPGRP